MLSSGFAANRSQRQNNREAQHLGRGPPGKSIVYSLQLQAARSNTVWRHNRCPNLLGVQQARLRRGPLVAAIIQHTQVSNFSKEQCALNILQLMRRCTTGSTLYTIFEVQAWLSILVRPCSAETAILLLQMYILKSHASTGRRPPVLQHYIPNRQAQHRTAVGVCRLTPAC